MFDFLDKIRAKPEKTRRMILHATTGVIMFVIMGVWASTLGARLSAPSEEKIAYENNTPTDTLRETAGALWSGIKSSFGSSTGGLKDLNATLKASSTKNQQTSLSTTTNTMTSAGDGNASSTASSTEGSDFQSAASTMATSSDFSAGTSSSSVPTSTTPVEILPSY
ncbi:MAG TPA: hypothetical protein VFM02_01750 [Candidatus Paceibacterota bacterium]|nr:hypothetical protein [Candidatus Paceibacterota bacterium]